MFAITVILHISLIGISLLLKADAMVCPAYIKPTDEYLDEVLKAIKNEEQNPQGFYLLVAMSSLMPVCCRRVSLLGTVPDEYPRKDSKGYVALEWNDV